MSSWQTPKTNWGQPGQTVPGVDDFNRIEGNIQHLQAELDAHLADNTRHRRIILSDQDANPNLMQNGDIWIKYTDEE